MRHDQALITYSIGVVFKFALNNDSLGVYDPPF